MVDVGWGHVIQAEMRMMVAAAAAADKLHREKMLELDCLLPPLPILLKSSHY